ncbi:hypothetical protein [Pararhizobium mangrovi]|uniref:Uncharacterized protein n=1 Tax=Pararhizobium mangrovi TaxID=2590452 RepID=A0A506TZ80_9HYPH|nr:hypothetical protein [Pararhizobium mangrovi]TPW26044.1 hypothetical protein FJU11_16655 [Pararhizobium mangrovi]
MMKATRRTILQSLPFFGAATAVSALAAPVKVKPTPDERIAAAMVEIEAAMKEKYPGWRVQKTDDEHRALVGPKLIEGDVHSRAVLIYTSEERRGPEEARWFRHYLT